MYTNRRGHKTKVKTLELEFEIDKNVKWSGITNSARLTEAC